MYKYPVIYYFNPPINLLCISLPGEFTREKSQIVWIGTKPGWGKT